MRVQEGGCERESAKERECGRRAISKERKEDIFTPVLQRIKPCPSGRVGSNKLAKVYK